MKKDIPFPPVEKVHVAIVREPSTTQSDDWYAYLINHNEFPLDNILITSRGYGMNGGKRQDTTTLRFHVQNLNPQSYVKIERIVPEVFHLCNEYWLSYYIENQIYDKKFIFVPDTISQENCSHIEMLKLEGVLHS